MSQVAIKRELIAMLRKSIPVMNDEELGMMVITFNEVLELMDERGAISYEEEVEQDGI